MRVHALAAMPIFEYRKRMPIFEYPSVCREHCVL